MGTSKEEVDVVAAVPLDTYSEEDGQQWTEVKDDIMGHSKEHVENEMQQPTSSLCRERTVPRHLSDFIVEI